MANSNIKGLYYITHIENIASILKHGILSHALVEKQQVSYTPIYDSQIVSHRSHKETPDGKSLWQFANLYFQPRNPMLYRVIHEKNAEEIAILEVSPEILQFSNVFVSTGNAASSPSLILPAKKGVKNIEKMWKIIRSEWWKEEDGSKRKIMAECLVPDSINSDFIHTIYVSGHKVAEKVRKAIGLKKKHVVPEPHMFFQPTRRIGIGHGISLIEGDMFFSQMQTLTISVNTVGVMGKGLASRAKYQFPDVYVYYQDLCRRKQLKLSRPYVYKRETDIDTELAADPLSLPHPNSNKWFLLFATKEHWRTKSTLGGIESGLQWLLKNYKREDLQSLAVPALGCGLGGLAWREVGPLMCRYFAALKIPVSIYLPREQKLPETELTADFLLSQH